MCDKAVRRQVSRNTGDESEGQLHGDGRFMAWRVWVLDLFVISALTKLLWSHHHGSLGVKAEQVLHWVLSNLLPLMLTLPL